MTVAGAADLRFGFGQNWLQYAAALNEQRIERAENSLRQLLKVKSLDGLSFVDAGSGSGLFSLAAHRLGAAVHSFDYDQQSVECTTSVKARFAAADARWTIEQGSVLDRAYLASLGRFDVVYSWGVLHHTGHMWRALENLTDLVQPGGKLCIAIYNDQGFPSHAWRAVKLTYNRLPTGLRGVVLWPAFARLWGPTLLKGAARGRPLAAWRQYATERGMSPVTDTKDWVGGYPFEVASRESVIEFCLSRAFLLSNLIARDGIGCNEFLFEKRCRDVASSI